MRVQELTVEVRDASLNRVGQFLPADLVGFSLVGRFNNVGTWEITLPAEHRLAVALATPGAGIIVSHVTHGVILSGPTTSVENSSNTSDPVGSVKISGVDDSAILAERLAYPTPTTADVTLQTQSHDSVVSVKASTAMYTFVKHNLVNGIAPSVRVVPNLTCAADTMLGSTLTKRARFDILGQLLSEISVIDGLGFDIKQNDNALEFKVFQPVDRSGYIRMDVQNNTLASTAYGYGLPGLTHAIVAGQGDLEDRQFIQVETAESLAAETLWHRRIEQFIDQRNTDVVDELTQAGLEALAESGSTLMSVDVIPAEGYTMQYGRDWNLGDTVTVVVANQEVVAVVTQVALSIEADGVHVVATVGEPSGVDYDAMIAKSQVSAMKRIDALERVEGGAGGGGAAIQIIDAAPVNPAPNTPWIRGTDGSFFVRWDDGDSQQWVEVKNPSNAYWNTQFDTFTARVAALENSMSAVKSGFYVRQVFSDIDTTFRSFGTGWTMVWSAPNHTGFKAKSKVKINIELPLRNNSMSWGGAYIEPQVTFNGGTNWYSLGSSGYDGNVMYESASSIATYTRMLLVDPVLAGIFSDFSFAVRIYARAYDGTVLWNSDHDLNSTSGTASLLSGSQNQNQHYARIHIEELATGQ